MKRCILLASFISLISCSTDDSNLPIIAACDTANPIEDLTWLRAQTEVIKNDQSDIAQYFFIEIAEYQNQTVFLANNCCPICGTVVPIYNCEGEQIGFLGSDILMDELSDTRIIFSRDDFSCQVN
ncbi:hypothetical protein EJ994_00980 [Maribacter sp. MJ134]|uniref:hypothetical protein n=1 Tax=Maribacter sp. MJ134 TaxID=2496865 RepID=UPI000F82DFB1|nr:hypothetical protein [Maribacter sp. MJ134]AZQ57448.1 hypothetical protein EJ994_00980 [Maribacter sp. MJ134]